MQRLNVLLENCYGIRHLETELDFSCNKAVLIYAPNGMMKTSLAKTFRDLSQGEDSKDLAYPDRTTVREITNEDKSPVAAEEVFVIEPINPSYESKRISTLLADSSLKSEYDGILNVIDQKTADLMRLLKRISGVGKGLEDIISVTFTKRPQNLLRAFYRVKAEVYEENEDPLLVSTKYGSIFSDKIQAFLNDEDIQVALNRYTDTYDALLKNSRFLKRGVFNHYQAGEIAKQLKNHGFFRAEHQILLTSESESIKVESEDRLTEIIQEELDTILSDPRLKSSFDAIEKKLITKELREFREYLLEHQTIIPRLADPELLKEDLLKSYLMAYRTEFKALMDEYESSKVRIEEITGQASEQATKWQEVMNIFNRRFSVPFKVGIENKEDVILKKVTPNITFSFEDEASVAKEMQRTQLLDILSSGQRRALYILNIIFEIEARKSDDIRTIFVVDDIADSFDYKNKYAIVEYLADMLSQDGFRQIILTHNYDFYRTVWHRLSLSGSNFHVSRSSEGISLIKETMYSNPFQKWRSQGAAFGEDNAIALVALIPFARNLAEYCGRESEFEDLTSLLHVKLNRDQMSIAKLLQIFKRIFNGNEFNSDRDQSMKVGELILETAESISNSDEKALALDRKLVLSIAIRIVAEQLLIYLINNDEWVQAVGKIQTGKLIRHFKNTIGAEAKFRTLVGIFDRVNLMTPENIHLNSFMYEPILDMSSKHLNDLYRDVIEAKNSWCAT